MKKRLMRILAAALCTVALLMPMGAQAAGTVSSTDIIRVGLYYGSTALPGANLQNSTGAGYRFGYFDGNDQFVELGRTDSTTTKISVVKAQNVYYSASAGNYLDDPTSIAVGCYHIRLPGSWSTYAEAQAAASAVGGFPAWIDGTYQVRVGAYLTKEEAQAAQTSLGLSGEIVGTSAYAVSVVVTGTSTVIFQFDGGSDLSLGIMPDVTGTSDAKTWFKGYQYYGGFRYQRNGGNLTVVNLLDLETYVKGVVPYEIGGSRPLEATKAQAVCARTYAARYMLNSKHTSYDFDVCNTTDCQVYYGAGSTTSYPTANTDQAVDETAGIFAWYNGSYAETYFFSSDGGGTESPSNVWGSSGSYPYLVGKVDPYEAYLADQIPNYNWTVTFTAQELTEILEAKGYLVGTVVDFYVAETTETGNVKKITFVGSNGKSYSFTKQSGVRSMLGLRSMRYTVAGGSGTVSGYPVNDGSVPTLDGLYAIDNNGVASALGGQIYAIDGTGSVQAVQPSVTGSTGSSGSSGTFVISGSGWGHHVGMSQWGAISMATQGYNYKEILQFYYTGIELY